MEEVINKTSRLPLLDKKLHCTSGLSPDALADFNVFRASSVQAGFTGGSVYGSALASPNVALTGNSGGCSGTLWKYLRE